MISSVRAKFTFWFIATFIVLILLSFGITETIFQKFAIKSIDESLKKGVGLLEQNLSECIVASQYPEGSAFQDCMDKQIQTLFTTEIVFVQVLKFPENEYSPLDTIAKSYTLFGKKLPFSPRAFEAVRKNQAFFETLDAGIIDSEARLLSEQFEFADGEMYILQFSIPISVSGIGKDTLRHPMTTRQHIFFTVFSVLLIVVTLWAFIFMKRVFAPIRRLVGLAKKITGENLSHRIDIGKSNDEIGELAETFNNMIERLDHSFQQIKQFSGDVSHELKTPLTAIKGEIEVTLRKERSPQEYRDVLTSLHEESEKLNKIVEDLLFLSRMDSQSFSVSFEPVELDNILMALHENTYKLAKQEGVALNLLNADCSKIMGDPGLIFQLLTNLIMNAVKYTPKDGHIDLSVQDENDFVVCIITDTGVGIPKDDQNKIFDRFYRVDDSRSKETGGSGLGLAIAKKIVEVHKGKISVESLPGMGCTFKVAFEIASK